MSDVKLTGLGSPPQPQVYLPFEQPIDGRPMLNFSVVVKIRNESAFTTEAVRGIVARINPDVPVFRAQPIESLLSTMVAGPRFRATLLAFCSGLAFHFTMIGVYGVTAFSASSRREEIGVRLCLGAQRGTITRMFLRESLTMALIGVASD
jgi:putative ABC transport system permease protein